MKEALSDSCQFQFISHFSDRYSYLDGIRMALVGGCRWIQLRMKNASDDEMRPIALEAQRMCKKAHAIFIIDDRVEMVKMVGADGVHLGITDMPIREARHILGSDAIIGATANTLDDVKRHAKAGADYIGCGPFRYTTTKQKLAPTLGQDGYRHIVEGMKAEGIQLPIVAIGGIRLSDIPDIMATGVTGIALSGTILKAVNPIAETANILAAINKAKLRTEQNGSAN